MFCFFKSLTTPNEQCSVVEEDHEEKSRINKPIKQVITTNTFPNYNVLWFCLSGIFLSTFEDFPLDWIGTPVKHHLLHLFGSLTCFLLLSESEEHRHQDELSIIILPGSSLIKLLHGASLASCSPNVLKFDFGSITIIKKKDHEIYLEAISKKVTLWCLHFVMQ